MITYKSRTLDSGQCTQFVEVTDGVVKKQWLKGNGNHSYTGNGNPEIVGKKESELRGFGFKKVSKALQQNLLETVD